MEDFILRMRSLDMGGICFKNTLYQAIRAPCAILVTAIEPSTESYSYMDKREYSEAIKDRLEPQGARDLYTNSFWSESRNC